MEVGEEGWGISRLGKVDRRKTLWVTMIGSVWQVRLLSGFTPWIQDYDKAQGEALSLAFN